LASPDPKPPKRIRDPELLRALHLEWRSCALCGSTGKLSLHHIHRHPRDDVRANLVMLCGSGTTGCHGRITVNDPVVIRHLGKHLIQQRKDTIEYLGAKLGGVLAVGEWLRRFGYIR